MGTEPPFDGWSPGAESETHAEILVPASPMTVEGVIEANRNMAQYANRETGWRRVVVLGLAVGCLLFIAAGIVVTLVTLIRQG